MKARDLIERLQNKLKSLARMESEIQAQQRYNAALKAAQQFLGVPSEDAIASDDEWVQSDDASSSSASEDEEIKEEGEESN